MTDLHQLTIAEAGRAFRKKALTSLDLTRHFLSRIAALDHRFHAFFTVTADRAMADASHADQELAQGHDRGPLHGIPYALKDTIDTAGIRTTMGSAMFADNMPVRDAAVASQLNAAGGVLLGKLATYEFGAVGPSFDLPFPPARNPWNENHITGGSSSGCAAAIAAGFARLAIGSDAGGSIRSPASYCGAVGLKPTFGAIDGEGLCVLSPSLDHVGLMAATVDEVLLGFQALTAITSDADVRADVKGLRIGYCPSWSAAVADQDVHQALESVADRLRTQGALVETVALPDYAPIEAAGTVILQKEAFESHHHLLRSSPKNYGTLAFQNLVSGVMLTVDDLAAAFALRKSCRETLDETVFSKSDALLIASTLTTAPPFREFSRDTPRWTAMRTFPFNVTGHPALAVPSGLSAKGLPMGVQIVGPHGREQMICRVGAAAAARLHYPEFKTELTAA